MNRQALIIALFCAATLHCAYSFPAEPVDSEEQTDKDEKDVFFDLKLVGIEKFSNGTERVESIEEILAMAKNADESDVHEKRTEGHKSDDDSAPEDRERRYIYVNDDRLPIDNERRFPYCAIGKLANGCTAAFIGPYHALTAGHCVYDRSAGDFRSDLNIYRRRNCNSYGVYMRWQRVFTTYGYAIQGNSDYDYALISYDPSVSTTCWMGLGYLDPWSNAGFDVIGYPSDKTASRVSGCSYDSMSFSSCHYSEAVSSERAVRYRCDWSSSTFTGTGAPLYGQWEGTDQSGHKYVYGVHTRNYYTSYSNDIKWESGTRINKANFDQIVNWMRQTGHDPTCASGSC